MTHQSSSTIRAFGVLGVLALTLLLPACEFDLDGLERDGEIRVAMAADEAAIDGTPSGPTAVEGVVEVVFRVFVDRGDGVLRPLQSSPMTATMEIGAEYLTFGRGLAPGPVSEIVVEIDRVDAADIRGTILGRPALGAYFVPIVPGEPVILRHTVPFDLTAATQHTFWIDLNTHEWIEFHDAGHAVPVVAFARAIRTAFD